MYQHKGNVLPTATDDFGYERSPDGWTTGSHSDISHQGIIGVGGYGQVHKVVSLLNRL